MEEMTETYYKLITYDEVYLNEINENIKINTCIYLDREKYTQNKLLILKTKKDKITEILRNSVITSEAEIIKIYDFNELKDVIEILKINKNTECIINNACYTGNLNILEWLKRENYEFNYDENAMNNACKNGHIHVLKWFLKNGYKLKCYSDSEDDATKNAILNNQLDVLKWLNKYDYLRFGMSMINYICRGGNVEILEWFIESEKINKLDFNIPEMISETCSSGKTEILEWIEKRYDFNYDNKAINNALKGGHINILEWFKNKNYELKYGKLGIDGVLSNGRLNVLEWLKKNNYDIKYTNTGITCAELNDFTISIEWLENNNYLNEEHMTMMDYNYKEVLKYLMGA
jgi:hypothetical protein